MAENRQPSDQQISEGQRTSNALAQAANEAEARQADETIPGGKYRVGDDLFDAEGQPFKDKKD